MKYFIVCLVLCLISAVHSIPAKRKSLISDDEVETDFEIIHPNRHQKHGVPAVPEVIEVDVGSDEDSGFFPAYFRPFFFNPLRFINFDFFMPSWIDSFRPKINPDSFTNKNETSTTKIVNGHKVIVNDSSYTDENTGTVYRLKVIEVFPVDSKEADSKESGEKAEKGEKGPAETSSESDMEVDRKTVPQEVKPDKNSQDNEIHKEEKFQNFELQGDDPNVAENYVDYGSENMQKRDSYVDLSSDIRVNRLKSENILRGELFMIPKDVDVFDPKHYEQDKMQYQNQEIIDPEMNQEIVQPSLQEFQVN